MLPEKIRSSKYSLNLTSKYSFLPSKKVVYVYKYSNDAVYATFILTQARQISVLNQRSLLSRVEFGKRAWDDELRKYRALEGNISWIHRRLVVVATNKRARVRRGRFIFKRHPDIRACAGGHSEF